MQGTCGQNECLWSLERVSNNEGIGGVVSSSSEKSFRIWDHLQIRRSQITGRTDRWVAVTEIAVTTHRVGVVVVVPQKKSYIQTAAAMC